MTFLDDDAPGPCAVCGAAGDGVCDACGRPFCEEHGFYDREGQPFCHACEEARYEYWRRLYESRELEREILRDIDWSRVEITLSEYKALKGRNPYLSADEAREAILRRAMGKA